MGGLFLFFFFFYIFQASLRTLFPSPFISWIHILMTDVCVALISELMRLCQGRLCSIPAFWKHMGVFVFGPVQSQFSTLAFTICFIYLFLIEQRTDPVAHFPYVVLLRSRQAPGIVGYHPSIHSSMAWLRSLPFIWGLARYSCVWWQLPSGYVDFGAPVDIQGGRYQKWHSFIPNILGSKGCWIILLEFLFYFP